MEFIYRNKVYITLILIIIVLLVIIYINDVSKEKIVFNEEIEERIYVDIKGYVSSPGVKEMTRGERVIDLIEASGGLLKNADTSNINLSRKLEDEDLVIIEKKYEAENQNDLISINNATIELLTTLPGIGVSKAEDIINYRKTKRFKDLEELMNIKGIGEAIFAQIKNLITL